MSDTQNNDVESVYRELVKGVGREKVTEANAAELIKMADRDKHTVLAEELREWAMGCGGALTPGQGGDVSQ